MPRRANVHAGAGAGAGAGNDGGLGAELEYENDDGLTEFDRQVLTIIEQYPNVRACRGVVAATISCPCCCPHQCDAILRRLLFRAAPTPFCKVRYRTPPSSWRCSTSW